MTKRKVCTFAVALVIAFVLFAVLSLTFIAVESDHNCMGEDCPVCEQIAFLTAALRTTVLAVCIAFVLAFSAGMIQKLFVIRQTEFITVTPILLKTKLSN